MCFAATRRRGEGQKEGKGGDRGNGRRTAPREAGGWLVRDSKEGERVRATKPRSVASASMTLGSSLARPYQIPFSELIPYQEVLGILLLAYTN